MESFSKQKWDELNLSRDELKNIGEALQKEEFRSLLVDYVKEINDPENRKQYEKEITQLENERGVDIKFIHPSSGYVIKTSVDGKIKAFINICSNTNVGKPSSTPEVNGEHRGLCWSIPHCLAPPREDIDKKNKLCTVYDVVFHPETLELAKNNDALKKLVNDTALSAVEDNFNVSLDKINLKFPKMQFKGFKHATVIRKKRENFEPAETIDIPNYPYPHVKENIHPETKCVQTKNVDLTKSDKDIKYTTPKYSIKYRNNVDMQNYTNDRMSKIHITVPNELVIVIDLPLLKCAADASIDVTEDSLILLSEKPVKYKLNLSLPYIVDNKGNAKFDVNKKILTVVLPVLKQKISSHVDSAREDSGVESDNCYRRSSSLSSSGDEDGSEKESSVSKSEPDDVLNSITQISSSTANNFLKNNVHYILPNFNCQLLKGTLTFTLQVSNVNPESVEYRFLNNHSGLHLSFQSMGTGFYPVNYAMCVILPPHNHMENETLSVEVWDNNVIAQVNLKSTNIYLTEYYVGTDENVVKKFTFTSLSQTMESKYTQKGINSAPDVEVNENVIFEESSRSGTRSKDQDFPDSTSDGNTGFSQDNTSTHASLQTSELQIQEKDGSDSSCETKNVENEDVKLVDEDKELSVSESASSFDESTSSPQRQPTKSRTVSESHQGEQMRSKNRGILKIGRSLSESSVDDYASWSAEKIEKTKKTVRFSETISKQTFRMNSSILGQRKKNQRKTRNKKRAQERRLSESGGESEGENEASLFKEKQSSIYKEADIWFKETESSSCDVSEVSEVSDISESDDGQKEERKPFTPCSNRKNHKRRGKKSARKSASTAKLQFMEN